MRQSIQRQSLAHNEGKTFFFKACVLRRNFSNFSFNSLLHCYCIWIKQDCRDQRKCDTVFMFAGRDGRNWNIMRNQSVVFLICSAHSIPFSQWKNSYFPLRPESLVGYKLSRVALKTRMTSRAFTQVNTCAVYSHWHEWLPVGVRDLKNVYYFEAL